MPAPYGELVARVATSPHRVTDRTVAELRDAGASQDAVLEVVLAAALGGGVVSLERGLDALAALDGGGADPTGGDGRGGA